MHPDLDKMIEIVSEGETITLRQIEIIRSFAQSLGEDPDEVENLLEYRFSKNNRTTNSSPIRRRIGKYDFHDSGCIYEGEIVNGVAEGEGVIYYPQQYGTVLYEGDFHNGNRHGTGTLYIDDGITKCYEGQWIDDEMSGTGIFFGEDGVTKLYEGNHHNGYYEGKGLLFDKTGQRYYEGEFHNSDFHGRGTIYRKGIKLCEGEFSNGQMVRGALFKNGIRIYDGPLPPVEDGLIRPGARFNASMNDCQSVFQEYILNMPNNKYRN